MDAQILTILHRIERKLEEHDGRFDEVDRRFDDHDRRFGEHDRILNDMSGMFVREMNLIHGRLDKLEDGHRHLAILIEHQQGLLRLVAEGFSGHSARLEDHDLRIARLEQSV